MPLLFNGAILRIEFVAGGRSKRNSLLPRLVCEAGRSRLPVGSGKSTASHAVRDEINRLWKELHRSGEEVCAILPMDGFHFYKRELDAMPDPKEAYARRGAHWTFNSVAFVDCVRRVQSQVGVPLSRASCPHTYRAPPTRPPGRSLRVRALI